MSLETRLARATEIAHAAGAQALEYFRAQGDLVVDTKGHLDFVSQADTEVETTVRGRLAAAFPDDAIVGEEHAPAPGTSGFTWVIDPIDGTANFVAGIPVWAVVIAGIADGQTQVSVTFDPCNGETFAACRGGGATLNGQPMRVSDAAGLGQGTLGVGLSSRANADNVVSLIGGIISAGGLFYRNASGALSLAYVAAGRLTGYAEQHMNAWDCLAGQLQIEEAGGRVEPQNADQMVAAGGRVIAAGPRVFDDLLALADKTFV